MRYVLKKYVFDGYNSEINIDAQIVEVLSMRKTEPYRGCPTPTWEITALVEAP